MTRLVRYSPNRASSLRFDDGEGLHNVVHIVTCDAVEVEIGGIQFATEQEAPLFVPAEGWAIVATIFGKGLQVPGSIGELQHTGEEPLAQLLRRRPGTGLTIGRGGRMGKLIPIVTTRF